MSLMNFFLKEKPIPKDETNTADFCDAPMPETTRVLLSFIEEKKISLNVDIDHQFHQSRTFKIIENNPENLSYKIAADHVLEADIPFEVGSDCVLSANSLNLHVIFYGLVVGQSWSKEFGLVYELKYPPCYIVHALRKEKRVLIKTRNPVVSFLLESKASESISSLMLDLSYSGFSCVLKNTEDKQFFKRDQRRACNLQIPFENQMERISCVVSIRHVTRSANGLDTELGVKIIQIDSGNKEVLLRFLHSQL